MNANELRIGNYIKNEGVVMQADGMTIFDIAFCVKAERYEPIPLGLAWLERFGYEEKEENGDHAIYNQTFPDTGISIIADGSGFWWFDEVGNGQLLKTVHQLQNLYFALTGYELTT